MVDEETAQDIEDLMSDIEEARVGFGLSKDDSIGTLLESLEELSDTEGDD